MDETHEIPEAVVEVLQAPEPVVAPAAPTDAVVDTWFFETFHNIGLPVELFNRFNAARSDLKVRLAALTKE